MEARAEEERRDPQRVQPFVDPAPPLLRPDECCDAQVEQMGSCLLFLERSLLTQKECGVREERRRQWNERGGVLERRANECFEGNLQWPRIVMHGRREVGQLLLDGGQDEVLFVREMT